MDPVVANARIRARDIGGPDLRPRARHRPGDQRRRADRLDGLRGSSMVTVGLEPWRQKLLAAPWVADVAMRRIFPGTVAVVITEREPLGIGRIRNSLFLIDREGSIIDEFGPKYADFDLPI